jgi:hypothetical protein
MVLQETGAASPIVPCPWTFETLEPRLLLSADPLTTLQTEILTATLSENPEPAP